MKKIEKIIAVVAIVVIASVMAIGIYEKAPEIQEPEVNVETTQVATEVAEPWSKYQNGIENKMEQLLPLATDGNMYVVDQEFIWNDDGTILWSVTAVDQTVGEEITDSVEIADCWNLVLINAELEEQLEQYQ